MDFGEAIHALKGGKRVSRAGWNGRGMYLYLVRNGSCPDETMVSSSARSVCRPPSIGTTNWY